MTRWCWWRVLRTAPMKPIRVEFEKQYLSALEAYLQQGGEEARQEAYGLGRRALAGGLGILDMVAIHHRTAALILSRMKTPEESLDAMETACEFLAESMAPFEMTHRAYADAKIALTRLNEILEEESKRIAHALHDQ